MERKLINGKHYPLWQQFIDKKEEWIGGLLQDFGDSMDRQLFPEAENGITTEITDIRLEPNGEDSAFIFIDGEDFDCGFDVEHGGIIAGDEGWITFSGYGGHKWRIKQKSKND